MIMVNESVYLCVYRMYYNVISWRWRMTGHFVSGIQQLKRRQIGVWVVARRMQGENAWETEQVVEFYKRLLSRLVTSYRSASPFI